MAAYDFVSTARLNLDCRHTWKLMSPPIPMPTKAQFSRAMARAASAAADGLARVVMMLREAIGSWTLVCGVCGVQYVGVHYVACESGRVGHFPAWRTGISRSHFKEG